MFLLLESHGERIGSAKLPAANFLADQPRFQPQWVVLDPGSSYGDYGGYAIKARTDEQAVQRAT